MEVKNFYKWWTEKIKGNYIKNEDFENVLIRFDDKKHTNLTVKNL